MNTSNVGFGSRVRSAALRALPAVPAALAVVLLALPVHAHHSAAVFDSTREVALKGIVRVMEWTNPHVWIRVDVTDEQGETVVWGVEASNPLDLGRKGWTRDTFKPGDEVTITVHPAKNNKPFGSFVNATLPDGSYLGEGSVTGEVDTPSRDAD